MRSSLYDVFQELGKECLCLSIADERLQGQSTGYLRGDLQAAVTLRRAEQFEI
jgi:hypothetical protein